MPKQYNVQKAKWTKPDDVYWPQALAQIDDIVIPVMGSSGVGKSTFINNTLRALGLHAQAAVDDSYEACTSKVAHYVACIPSTVFPGCKNRRLVLVDTPGFDHGSLSNEEILRRVAVWLASSYGDGIKVAGVVYIHGIGPGRMTDSQASGLEIFKRICGEDAFPNIILATTRWNMSQTESDSQRENELRDTFWHSMLSGPQQAAMVRLYDSPTSALDVVKKIIDHTLASVGMALLLQRQIVDEKKSFGKTDAGLLAKPRGSSPLTKAAASFRKLIMGFR